MEDFLAWPSSGSSKGPPSTIYSSTSDSGEDEDKPYKLNGLYAYVTWSRSTFHDQHEFHEKLKSLMPDGTNIYGGKESHKDGTPHYHVTMKFPKRLHWTNARPKFMIPGDTTAVRISKPRKGQRIKEFLERTQAYPEKDDNKDLFGERIATDSSTLEERKRVFEEIDAEKDFDTAKTMLRTHDPYCFASNYKNYLSYLKSEKRRKIVEDMEVPDYEILPYKVPKEVMDWVRDNIDSPQPGRRKSLILVGEPGTGKTEWAKSFGRPIVMSTMWKMDAIFEGASHLVVNDVQAKKFGYGGNTYWREVLGCQTKFNAKDFQHAPETIKWGIPCIWTCSYDLDPRRVEGVREYIAKTCVVVEVNENLF